MFLTASDAVEYTPGLAGMVCIHVAFLMTSLYFGLGMALARCHNLTLLVVVRFCNCEYSAKLIFKSVDGLWGDHAIEACRFVAEGDQRVVGCIAFGGCRFCTLLVPLLLACFGCEKAC